MEPLLDQDPKRIGPYSLVARLGSGGMGTVYLAARGQNTVALKVISAGTNDQSALRRRFAREIENLKKMQSPFIAGVLDSNIDKNSSWLAVSYVSGLTVLQEVNENGPLDNSRVWELAICGLIALSQVHQMGVVHRDIKPANILLSETGPKLIDFGISEATDDTSLTTTGLVAGSPAWLAPEQLDVGDVTGAADLFSLTSLLVFAASGQSPWGNQNTMSVPILFNKILSETPDVSPLGPKLGQIFRPALAKDPLERPAASALLSSSIQAAPTEVLQRVQNWLNLHSSQHFRKGQPGSVLLDAVGQVAARLDAHAQPPMDSPRPGRPEDSSIAETSPISLGRETRRLGSRVREVVLMVSSALAAGVLVLAGLTFGTEDSAQKADDRTEIDLLPVPDAVDPPIYSFTTVSDSGAATLSPGDGNEVISDEEFDINLSFAEGQEFLDDSLPEVSMFSVDNAELENPCLGTESMVAIEGTPSEFMLTCSGIPEGSYIIRAIWAVENDGDDGESFGRETITAFVEAVAPPAPVRGPETQQAGRGAGSIAYDFLGGGWGAFDDAQYFSISGTNLVRSWCLRSAPGIAWRDDNNWAEILNPDGSVAERVASTQNQGPCTITGSINGMEDGDPGELRTIVVPRSSLSSRLDPTNCLIVRFRAGGTSFQPEFNDICVRG